MGKKILETFTNNLGFKILAVLFAFVLWLVVYNLNDPIKTKTFTTTVSVTGKDAVVDMGKWPTIKESDKTISFSVSGKRSYLSNLDDSDFYASADLSNIVISKDDPSSATVKVDIGCTKYKSSVTFNGGDHTIPVAIENYMQKQFEVKVSVSGDLSGAKAIGDNPQANPRVVKIGGPESIVSTIASANVSIKVDENTIVTDNQITDRGDLVLLNENGDEVDQSALDIDSQYNSIEVTVDVLSTKEVPLKCSYTGTPAGGKGVLAVNLSEESVELKGSAEDMNNITSIDVGPIDISGATSDVKTSVDLSGYLPDGVSLVNSGKAKLNVEIQIETNASATMTLDSSHIAYDGLADGEKLSFVTDKTSVIVSGTQSDIDSLSGSTLRGKIDVSGLSVGTHTVTVTLSLDDSKYTWGEIKVQIVIEKEQSTDTGTGSDSSSGSGTGSSENGNNNNNNSNNNSNNSDSGTGNNTGSDGSSGSTTGN
ncbi:CdaR family protein [Agathobacter sp.]